MNLETFSQIDEDLKKKIGQFMKSKNVSFEVAIKLLLEEGLNHLSLFECEICHNNVGKKLLETCDNCEKQVHCGYSISQTHSEWEGDTWKNDPSFCCFFCYIDEIFERYIDDEDFDCEKEYGSHFYFDDYQKFLLNYIDKRFDECNDDFDDGMSTNIILDYYKIIKPETWKYIDQYLNEHYEYDEDEDSYKIKDN